MIFLSHSSRDKPFVRFIGEELRACGLSCWLDEKDLLPGNQLTPTIERAVGASGHLLVFLSPASLGSRWVMLEIEMARRLQHSAAERLIPCLTAGVEPENLPPPLADILCVDLREPASYERQMGRLLGPLAAGRRSVRWPSFDAHRSAHIVQRGQDLGVVAWILAWLFATAGARPDDTERYWAYRTIAQLPDDGVRAFLHGRVACENGLARRGALDGLAILDGRASAARRQGGMP